MAGYSAVGLLLGGYMLKYTDARELDLGFVFMIQPITIFLRPLICARADRYRSHKSMLAGFLFGTAASYLPFILIPYLIEVDSLRELLSLRVRFWILVVGHLLGSICFCGIRSLGDASAVNYAKRTGSDYANYRKWGSISFGLCGYLLGQINQDWLLPDFVPSMIVYSFTTALEGLLVYLWPDEHFYMVGGADEKDRADDLRPLPVGREIWDHMIRKLWRTITCRRTSDISSNLQLQSAHLKTNSKTNTDRKDSDTKVVAKPIAKPKSLSVKTQARIFLLLLRYDYRISAYMLILLYAGLVGYSPPNFVFTHMDQVCHEKGTCNGAALAGLVMLAYCVVETICYMILDALRDKLTNRVLLLEITLLSLAIHYHFYGFVLEHVSPYFFLVECLHGLEYSVSLSTCMEFGYRFANEVNILMPELLRRGIISENDDHELVKVSLMATMSGCFTLVYDGFGTIIGSLAIGVVVHNYSFTVAWIMIGTLATIGFFAIIIGAITVKSFGIRPTIEKFRRETHIGRSDLPASDV